MLSRLSVRSVVVIILLIGVLEKRRSLFTRLRLIFWQITIIHRYRNKRRPGLSSRPSHRECRITIRETLVMQN
ncbi:MAG: hypothetical protein ACR2LR_27685 [Hassallia sp.]